MKAKIYPCFALVLILSAGLTFPAVAVEPQALAFSRVEYNPASVGAAGTALLTSRRAYSAFGNTAIAALSDGKFDAAVSYMGWTPGVSLANDISAGVAGCFRNFSVSGAFVYDIFPKFSSKYQEKDIMAGVGLAYRFADFISVGINGKYASQTLSSSLKWGAFMADVYLGGKIAGFSYTVGAVSLGGKVKAEGKDYSLPSSIRAGVGYEAEFGGKHSIGVSFDPEYYFAGAFCAAAGAQYVYNEMLSLRAGYRYGGKSIIPSFASVGAGFHIGGFRIDAAYLFADDVLKNTFAIGIGYGF